MDQYIVSARKYRPSTFASLVGQQTLANTLKNAIATERLAHAYLFCGGRGVGKTSCARIFAKTINCTSRTPDGEACNKCDSCRQFNEGRSLNILELDAASNNGVDDVRQLVEQVMVPPATGRYRIFIIDEVHMLSTAAFNAFLKTLEEPPAHAIFILATTEKHKIIPTILSRCQIYDFNRITEADMVAHLAYVADKEGIEAERSALAVIASKADGAMRDALSIFDQVAASTSGKITYQATVDNLNVLDASYFNRLMDAFLTEDVSSALLIYKEIRERGFDSQFFISGLARYLRDIMVCGNESTASLADTSEELRAGMAERAAKISPTLLYRAMEICNEADFNYRAASNKQFLVELTLIRLCQSLSPAPENDGADAGQLRPLKPAATPATEYPGSVEHEATVPPEARMAARGGSASASGATSSGAGEADKAAAAPKYAPGSFSMRIGMAAVKADTSMPAAPAEPAAARSNDFTEADLKAVWPQTVEKQHGNTLLYSALQAAVVSLEDKVVTITVGAELMQTTVDSYRATLEADLRDALSNDRLTVTTALNVDDSDPTYWSQKRVVEYMLKEHPALAELIKKYKLRDS